MTISVVMTTYNGEKYIYEQMFSIYKQSRKADEVIICDDCSNDKTVEIIQDFIEKYHLINWRLIINEKNKGWKRNFIEALQETSGSLLFFSDQDDIWYNDKIEVMSKQMERTPKIQCLSGKMVTIDENGKVFEGKNEFSAGTGTDKLIYHPFSERFNTITLLGCTMCITRKLADIIIHINMIEYGHDAQCCRLGELLDGTYTLDRPVIQYRLHNSNTSGVVSGISFGSANLQKRISDIEKNIEWLEKVLKSTKEYHFLKGKKKNIVERTIQFQKLRWDFLNGKNIIKFVRLFRYRKYYSGLSMYLGDFAYAFHINKFSGKLLWKINRSGKKQK